MSGPSRHPRSQGKDERRQRRCRMQQGRAPPETAKALVRYALELEAQERHAGGCADPGEKAAWQAVQRWLRAWRGGQLGQTPTPTGEEWRAGVLSNDTHKARRKSRAVRFAQIEEGEHCLGPGEAPTTACVEAPKPDLAHQREELPPRRRSPRSRGRGQIAAPAALVKPAALGAARERLAHPGGPPELGGPGFGKWLEGQKLEALMMRLSEGTRSGYEGSWRQWVLFRGARGESPWLEGRDRAERKQNEDDLITYAVLLARAMKRSDGTVKQKLFAIRYAHLAMGYGDPLLHRSRLWATLAGLHRWQGPGKRKSQ